MIDPTIVDAAKEKANMALDSTKAITSQAMTSLLGRKDATKSWFQGKLAQGMALATPAVVAIPAGSVATTMPVLAESSSFADQALNDLMPIIGHLVQADVATTTSNPTEVDEHLQRALVAFQALPPSGPAYTAYMKWFGHHTGEALPTTSTAPTTATTLRP